MVRSYARWHRGNWSQKAQENRPVTDIALKGSERPKHTHRENTYAEVRNKVQRERHGKQSFCGLQSHLDLTDAQLRPSAQQKIQDLSSLENKHDFQVLELASQGRVAVNSTGKQLG